VLAGGQRRVERALIMPSVSRLKMHPDWNFRQQSLQVIIFDPRGCGRSTHYQGVYTIEQMAADVIALLQSAADRKLDQGV
jgi:pimeloyl-ACP methyl ester carboxylesterase